jgi:hypothetical protein
MRGRRLEKAMDLAGWRFDCKISAQDKAAAALCIYDTIRSVKGDGLRVNGYMFVVTRDHRRIQTPASRERKTQANSM